MSYTVKQRLVPIGVLRWQKDGGELVLRVTCCSQFYTVRQLIKEAITDEGYHLDTSDSGAIVVVQEAISHATLAYVVEMGGHSVAVKGATNRTPLEFRPWSPALPPDDLLEFAPPPRPCQADYRSESEWQDALAEWDNEYQRRGE